MLIINDSYLLVSDALFGAYLYDYPNLPIFANKKRKTYESGCYRQML